jgi:large subunit ribosomal protein L5e
MAFAKVVKNNAYFKRYQVKYRRRRENKTDYYARRRLVAQDRNKYNSPRYRLVVRLTNKDVITQIVYSKIVGDVVLAAAYAHELPLFGAKVGLTNYAACYATGLLLARRLLTKYKLADKHKDATEVAEGGQRKFKAVLDVGLARTTTGARIFAALKGAVDGGLNIPHSEKRFVGYDKEKGELNNEKLRQRLFALHVAEYQKTLKAEDEDTYNKQFSQYVKNGVAPDAIEKMWKATHDAIRKEPTKRAGLKANKEEMKKASKKAKQRKYTTAEKRNRRTQKRSFLQRKKRELAAAKE